MESNKSFWNYCVPKYDFWHNLEKSSYTKVADNIVKNIQLGDSILELACGTGILTETISSRHSMPLNYIATDFSPKMIEVCKQKTSSVEFKIADATKLEYDDKSFNYIIIANALHIMPQPEKALAEVYRVLKDDGRLFAPQFLTATTFKEQLVLNVTRMLGYKVFNEFELETYLAFLNNNGFDVTKHEVYTCFRNMLYVECTKHSLEQLGEIDSCMKKIR